MALDLLDHPPIVIAVALTVLAAWVDPPRAETREKFDAAGLVTLVSGLGMFVFALMQGPDWGWSNPAVWLLFASGMVVLMVFAVVELRTEVPLIEVDLFRDPSFAACNLVVFTAQFTKIAVIVFGALYLQHALHMSPLDAGFALLVAVEPNPLTAVFAGRCADRHGARLPSLAGLALAGSALLSIGLAVSWNSYGLLVPALLAWGITVAFLFMPPQRAVMNAVPRAKPGGINLTVQLLGGTIGMAVCSTLYAMTGDFRVVFLATAGVVFTVLALGWLAIERPGGAIQPARGS